jgi:2-polyprenyl-6-hydroxyphenyl methylase / 3-demethylubiquinone-9 3-methyltransferase
MHGWIEGARRSTPSVDPYEIDRFAARADAWWDPEGSFRALHRLNPARIDFIRSTLSAHFVRDTSSLEPFAGLRLLDIGCGGGLIAEAMARLGADVIGIDAGAEAIAAARSHAESVGLTIDYRRAAAEDLAGEGEAFDAVLALEVIEHVAEGNAFFQALGRLLRPSGAFIASTLNRTAKSFFLAIVGAEYILGWVPRATHDWRRFVRPSELAHDLRRVGLRLTQLQGIGFDPKTGGWRLSSDLKVNYLAMAVALGSSAGVGVEGRGVSP